MDKLIILRNIMTKFISEHAFSNQDYFTKNNLPNFQPNLVIRKTVTHKYGICMELNYTFNEILKKNNFNSRLVKCHKINPKTGDFYNIYHLAIIVEIINEKYFIDVGYGEYFIEPVLLVDNNQTGNIKVKHISETHDNYAMYDLSVDTEFIFRVVDLEIDSILDIDENYCKFFTSKPCDFPLCRVLFERLFNPSTGTFDVVKSTCKL
ncbi:putative acetyltransferase [Cotonvirus japonicus]|uniref:Acetyltransferase n=1 Tax=Cotonvirus japonicus TaxID=2811091 RepID=A0ABM7NRN1_9VIRU|nr:putative acetyltransferase [Cotonvirus japonicus]BCS82811.1 putative acetyltransferase [Cotonvirus japonicus]